MRVPCSTLLTIRGHKNVAERSRACESLDALGTDAVIVTDQNDHPRPPHGDVMGAADNAFSAQGRRRSSPRGAARATEDHHFARQADLGRHSRGGRFNRRPHPKRVRYQARHAPRRRLDSEDAYHVLKANKTPSSEN